MISIDKIKKNNKVGNAYETGRTIKKCAEIKSNKNNLKMSFQVLSTDYWSSLIKPVIADLGVALVFGVGYHLIKKLNRDTKSPPEIKDKIKTSISKWNEVKTSQKFNTLITTNKDKSMDAYKILHLIETNNLTPDIITYNCLLDMSFRLEQNETAHKLFEEISEKTFPVQPDTVTYNILLKQLVNEINRRESNLDQVKNLLKDMSERNIEMNQITFNTAIDAAIEAHDFNYAWDLFEKMNANTSAVKPDLYTYSTLIKGLKSLNETYSNRKNNDEVNCNRAIEILNLVKSNTDIKVDDVLYNSVLDTCVSFNKMHLAEEIFNEMKMSNIAPSLITYSIMIKGYGQNHNLKGSIDIYNELKDNNLKANDIIYGCLLNSCVKCNKVDLLDSFYNNMLNDKIEPNAIIYTTMIKGYNKAKKFQKAFELFESIKTDNKEVLNIVIYNAILDACVESNETGKLKKIFKELTENAKNKENCPTPNVITYSTMIKGLAKSGEIEDAQKIYEFVLNNFDEIDEVLFNTIADGFARSNHEAIALSVLDEMKKRNIKRSSIIYSILMRMYSYMNREDKCVAMFNAMKEDNIEPSLITYTILMQMYIKKKKINDAMKVFNELDAKLEADFVSYNFIINACTFNQKLEFAIEYLIKSIKKHIKLSEDTYHNVVNYLIENKFMKHQARINYAQELLKNFKENQIGLRNDLFQKITKLIYHNKGNNKEVEKEIKGNNNRGYYKRNQYNKSHY